MMNHKITQRFAEIKHIFSSIIKSLWWFVLTVISGFLLSLIIFATHSVISFERNIYEELMIGGGILSFSIAILSSLAIDYHIFSQPFFPSKQLNNLVFITIPIIMILACSFLFLSCYLKPDEIIFETMLLFQIAIFLLTAAYAIIVKWVAFNKRV